MTIENISHSDFERALFKGFWRQVISYLKGTTNNLLPYDDIRKLLPMKGQRYLGLREVSIDKIIGSQGRYLDFDRAFLPTQTRTKGRWMSIDKAHLEQIILPPVDLYKIGEVYFVRDGNHRVSVARERGQQFIDAYVIEIDVPIQLTSDMDVDDIAAKQAYIQFLEHTKLKELRQDANIDHLNSIQSEVLIDHISFHQWILGEIEGKDIPYAQAVTSWYDDVFLPIVDAIHKYDVSDEFPNATDTDLYVWITKYQWYLSMTYREDMEGFEDPVKHHHDLAMDRLKKEEPKAPIKKIHRIMNKEDWLIDLIIQQEFAEFSVKTHLQSHRPGEKIITSIPGQYEILIEHIAVHRWYLGKEQNAPVPFKTAAASWYDNVYLPLVEIVRSKKILDHFPGRTETDLYLWIMSHQEYLSQVFGSDPTILNPKD